VTAPRSTPPAPLVAPSILAADFAHLERDVRLVDPALDWLHCDVMDNHFVPNLTFGPLLIEAMRRLTSALLDVHLMITEPERIVPAFAEAGADQITVHLEASRDPARALEAIRGAGKKVGLALKPGTPLALAEPFLGSLDLLLVMTVEPGFGGQAFMADMMPKVAEAKAWRERHAARFLIEVDGGIGEATARLARAAGADAFVAGNSIYRSSDPGSALKALRTAIR
jgi:ribulose-phosphate 3-epimerase